MTCTVDANVLLYASDRSSPRHDSAARLLAPLSVGPDLVYLFWPVAIAYLRVATHPNVFNRPLEPAAPATTSMRCCAGPTSAAPVRARTLTGLPRQRQGDVVRGNLVPDSHIAALMRVHGVSTIWTADRDFRRFPGITARDPEDEKPT